MQLVITAPASTAVTAPVADLTWVAKGGSSIVSKDGRWSLRKNSKGVWRVFLDGTHTGHELATKDEAKQYAATVSAPAEPMADVKAALHTGEAKVYSLRANGTMRRRHFLVGNALHEAQNVQDMRNSGASLAAIAGELHVSVSHVRRMLTDLAITTELMEAEADQLAALLIGAAEINE